MASQQFRRPHELRGVLGGVIAAALVGCDAAPISASGSATGADPDDASDRTDPPPSDGAPDETPPLGPGDGDTGDAPVVPLVAVGELVISELHLRAVPCATGTDLRFVEVSNPSGRAVPLDDLELVVDGRAHRVAPSGARLGVGERAALVVDLASAAACGAAWPPRTFEVPGVADVGGAVTRIALRSAGVEVDVVSPSALYASFGADGPPAGQSVHLLTDSLDAVSNDDADAWCLESATFAGGFASPGELLVACGQPACEDDPSIPTMAPWPPKWTAEDTYALSGCDWPVGNGYGGLTCAGGTWDGLADLTLPAGVSGLVVYRVVADAWWYGERVATLGTPCAGASDLEQCTADVDAAAPASLTAGPFLDPGWRVITTRGDTVATWTTPAEIGALFGGVTEPGVAALALYTDRAGLDQLPCELQIRDDPDGYRIVWEDRAAFTCGGALPSMRFRDLVGEDGKVTAEAEQFLELVDDGICIGRRPPGLRDLDRRAGLGAQFARHAAMEAASVVAFDHLHAELVALGAPDALLVRVRAAAADERRHAKQVAKLARRYGAEPLAPEVRPTPLRDAEAIAVDNAREGCVGETWGALEGLVQAETAADPAVRDVLRRIAEDEVRHAALSWELHAWLGERLDAAARARVACTLSASLMALRADLSSASGCARTGRPPADVAVRLLDGLEAAIAA